MGLELINKLQRWKCYLLLVWHLLWFWWYIFSCSCQR